MMSGKKRSLVRSYVNHDQGTDVPNELVFIAGIFIVIPSKTQHNVVFGFISDIWHLMNNAVKITTVRQISFIIPKIDCFNLKHNQQELWKDVPESF